MEETANEQAKRRSLTVPSSRTLDGQPVQELLTMGFAKIRGKLVSRVGCPVRYSAPRDVHQAGGAPGCGTIIDEVWAYPEVNDSATRSSRGTDDWGDYSFCSQLIRWDDGTHSIRLAYYRRRAGEDHWEYASQMTVDADPETIKTLLERTLAKDNWFAEKSSALPSD